MSEWLTQLLEHAVAAESVVVYVLIFAGGVVASFTPCTYPVLPMTVGYIGARAEGHRAKALLLSLALVLGMALVYAVGGTVLAATGQQLGTIWSNGWAMFAVACFFLLMGLFLLDALTFPMPGFLRRLQARAGKPREGLVGAFVMGGVSGLVVGPCTGPIVGVVLATVALDQAEGLDFVQQAIDGGVKLFLFGLGQGALIFLCGTFSGLLGYLPKSGQWMVRVKKGFALLVLAGASLLFVYVGQSTDFPRLFDLLARLEAEEPPPTEPDEAPPTQEFGGDEFLR